MTNTRPSGGRAVVGWRRTCLGQVVWNPRIAYGRVLAFELGAPALVVVREASSPRLGDAFPPPRAERASAHVAGAWSCWVNSEVWELYWQGEVVLACTDTKRRARSVLAHLKGHRLIDVKRLRREISLVFDGGLEVRAHPAVPPRTTGPFADDVVFRSEAEPREVGFNSLTSPVIRVAPSKRKRGRARGAAVGREPRQR